MNIFLTGGTGFTGRNLIEQLLASGHDLIALKRNNSDITGISEKVSWVDGDLNDYFSYQEAVKNVDVVVHCAARVDLRPFKRKEIFKTNVDGTANIVNLCMEHGKRLIFLSSTAALGGPLTNGALITEQTDFDLNQSNTDYAFSKHFAEMEVWRGIAEGLDAVVLNPSIIIGEFYNWRKGAGSMWQTIDKGLKFHPAGTAGYVDVLDLSNIIIKLLDSDISGERFIVSGENLSYKSFLEMIASELGKKPPSKPLGKPLRRAIAFLGYLQFLITRKKPVLSKAVLDITSMHFRYDNRKVKDVLNIEFTPIKDSVASITKAYLSSHDRL